MAMMDASAKAAAAAEEEEEKEAKEESGVVSYSLDELGSVGQTIFCPFLEQGIAKL